MTRVGKDTEEVFNDKFWENLDFVVNAVDNDADDGLDDDGEAPAALG